MHAWPRVSPHPTHARDTRTVQPIHVIPPAAPRTGLESNIGRCRSNPLWTHNCSPSEAAGVVCFPYFNVSSYCADVVANVPRVYPTPTNTTPDPSTWSRDQRLQRCGELMGLAAAASTLVGYKFPGQYISYREVQSYACGRENVVPAMTAWVAAWRREVAASGCTELIVPYLWMQRLGGTVPTAPSPPPVSFNTSAFRRPPPPPLPPAPPSRNNDSCPTAMAVWPTPADRTASDAAAPYGTPAVPAPTTYMILDYVSAPSPSSTSGSSGSTNNTVSSPLDMTCTPPSAWLAAGGAPNRYVRRSNSSSVARGPAPGPSNSSFRSPPPSRAPPLPFGYSFGFPPPPFRSNISSPSSSTFNSSAFNFNFSFISGAGRRLFRRALVDATLGAAVTATTGAPAPPPPPPPPPPLSAAAASLLRYGASGAMWASASAAFASVWSPRDLVNVSTLTRTLARGGPSWLPSRLSDRRHLLSTLELFSRPGGIDLVSSGILDTVRWALASLPSPPPPPDANRPPRPPSPPPFRWTDIGDIKDVAVTDAAPPRPPLRNIVSGGLSDGGSNSPSPPAPPSPPSPPPPGPRAPLSPLAAAMPLKPTCVAYDSSWTQADGFRSDFAMLDFLASNAASSDGGRDGWGQQVSQTETELLYCNARQELKVCAAAGDQLLSGGCRSAVLSCDVDCVLACVVNYVLPGKARVLPIPLHTHPAFLHRPSPPPLHQTRHTVSGIAITGLGLAGSAVSTVRSLLRGARPFNGSVTSDEGTAAIPAANLAFLDLSGNALTGGVPAIPVPVLHVNLSSNRLSGDLQNQLKNNLTAAAFTATLVLDLSNNGFTGQLPTRIDVAAPATNSSAWGALLTSAVRIDFSGNGFTGSLPADWAPLLAQMDLVVSRNPGLTGGVPAEWIAAARGLPPYGDGGSGPFSLGSMITATAPPPSPPSPPSPPRPPAPAGGGGAASGDGASSSTPPRQGALLIDLSGCTGLTGRFTHTADFSTLRVRACLRACVRVCLLVHVRAYVCLWP